MKFLSDYFNSGTVKQQNKKRFGALLICITAALLVVALIALMIASIATAIKGKAPSEEEGDDTAGSGIPSGYTTTTFDPAQLSSGALLLIDDTHTYTGTPSVVLFDAHESRSKASDGTIVYSIGGRYDLSATDETIRAFNAMIDAFYADESSGGDTNLYISGAYNINAANQISDLYKTGTVIALKYYVDFNADKNDIQTIYNVEKYNWLYDHAHEYGFIQASAAEGEENLFRYVGVAHATYMKNNSKTLAEYLEILQTRTASRPLSVQVSTKTADGQTASVTYNVYRLTAEETPVVPSKFSYTVSGDNMGGYIVTVDRSSSSATAN